MLTMRAPDPGASHRHCCAGCCWRVMLLAPVLLSLITSNSLGSQDTQQTIMRPVWLFMDLFHPDDIVSLSLIPLPSPLYSSPPTDPPH